MVPTSTSDGATECTSRKKRNLFSRKLNLNQHNNKNDTPLLASLSPTLIEALRFGSQPPCLPRWPSSASWRPASVSTSPCDVWCPRKRSIRPPRCRCRATSTGTGIAVVPAGAVLPCTFPPVSPTISSSASVTARTWWGRRLPTCWMSRSTAAPGLNGTATLHR